MLAGAWFLRVVGFRVLVGVDGWFVFGGFRFVARLGIVGGFGFG